MNLKYWPLLAAAWPALPVAARRVLTAQPEAFETPNVAKPSGTAQAGLSHALARGSLPAEAATNGSHGWQGGSCTDRQNRQS